MEAHLKEYIGYSLEWSVKVYVWVGMFIGAIAGYIDNHYEDLITAFAMALCGGLGMGAARTFWKILDKLLGPKNKDKDKDEESS